MNPRKLVASKFLLLAAAVDDAQTKARQDAAEGLRDQARTWHPDQESAAWVWPTYMVLTLGMGVLCLALAVWVSALSGFYRWIGYGNFVMAAVFAGMWGFDAFS